MYRETKKHFNPPDAAQPFWIQLTGTSYCDYTYRISRTLAQSDVYVIEYIISGEGTININDQQYHPRAGDFYLLQPGTPHEYYSSADRPWVKIFANVYGPLCRHVISTYGLEQTVLIRECDVQDKLQNFINTANSLELTESQIMIRCAALFVEIIAMASAVKNSDREPGSNAEADKLRDYINANTQRTLNINDLAKLVYRSPDYVIKLFKKPSAVRRITIRSSRRSRSASAASATVTTASPRSPQTLATVTRSIFQSCSKANAA